MWRSPKNFFAVYLLLILFSLGSSRNLSKHGHSKKFLFKSHSPKVNEEKQCDVSNNFRFDCYPEIGASQDKCEQRGCCWVPATSRNLDVPWCFYPKNYPGYRLVDSSKTSSGLTATFVRDSPSYYGNDIKSVRIDVTAVTTTELKIKIYDAEHSRYEVPYFNSNQNSVVDLETSDFDVTFDSLNIMKIIRKSTAETIFSVQEGFIFTDQFIQLSTLLPSPYVYGLGERQENFLRSVNWQQFTMFGADQSPRINTNLYGSHPFLLTLGKDSNPPVGIVLVNSNAMDVILQPAPAVTYRVVGGILDFRIFSGPDPSNVVKQFINFIGYPIMPPYWSLGFHLCRYGYMSSDRTREIWQKNRDAGIPFDVQWNDIDYMDQQRDFTYDKDKFAGLPQLVKDIHDVGMHYVVIIDPALDYTTTPNIYPPYDEGIKQDIFIKDANNNLFIGKVWSPNGAVFPDFTNPKTTEFWTEQLAKFHEIIPYDGVWIDMNEPANFVDGSISGCPDVPYENPPYVPGVNGGSLRHRTLCMTAKQNLSIHYNVHNLYGFTEAIATNKAVKTITNKRPFIISRSTFLGQGHYSGHWSGDNNANWDDLRMSIPAILDFNMFGVPMIGADICGFTGDSPSELCQRWMELGAFYPFSRNHNTINNKDQDPASMGYEIIKSSKYALSIRYLLLPYLYTLFYRATVYGETVARSLLFEFPHDVNTYGIDSQFLWGSGMMILPVVNEGATSTNSYFPAGTWYILRNLQRIDSTGMNVKLDAPLDIINVAFRAGYIIPGQKCKEEFTTTTESRKCLFNLNVFFDDNYSASGQLFWDDGESIDTIENKNYNLLSFKAEKGKLTSTVEVYEANEENMVLGLISIVGVKETVQEAFVNGEPQKVTYNKEQQQLLIEDMVVSMKSGFTVTWQ